MNQSFDFDSANSGTITMYTGDIVTTIYERILVDDTRTYETDYSLHSHIFIVLNPFHVTEYDLITSQ